MPYLDKTTFDALQADQALAFGFKGNAVPSVLMSVTAGVGWFATNSVSGAFALSTLFGIGPLLGLAGEVPPLLVVLHDRSDAQREADERDDQHVVGVVRVKVYVERRFYHITRKPLSAVVEGITIEGLGPEEKVYESDWTTAWIPRRETWMRPHNGDHAYATAHIPVSSFTVSMADADPEVDAALARVLVARGRWGA